LFGALQLLDKALGDDRRHYFVGVAEVTGSKWLKMRSPAPQTTGSPPGRGSAWGAASLAPDVIEGSRGQQLESNDFDNVENDGTFVRGVVPILCARYNSYGRGRGGAPFAMPSASTARHR
jgi:hypothetical protein